MKLFVLNPFARTFPIIGFALFSALTICSHAASEPSANWPQWRGPLGIGVAPKADPPVTWSEEKNIRWKVKIPGRGMATPVIWENKIFILTAIPTGKKVEQPAESASATPVPANPPGREGGQRPGGRGGGIRGPKPTEVYQFVVLCLDRHSGKILWQHIAGEEVPHEGRHRTEGSFASASPITDGQNVYAFFGSRGLHCCDLEGKHKWTVDLGKMKIVMSFGEGSSPALYKDMLFVNWDHEGDCFIVAFDKNTGKTIWKKSREGERTSWATPLVVEQNGKAQVITAATGKIRSYDPADGNIIWECAGLTRNVIPSPVTGDGLFFATSGYQGNALLAIRLGGTGDLTGTDSIAWSYKKNTPYVPSPLLYEGRIYFYENNNAKLSCLDAKSGRVLIDGQKMEGMEGVYASPVGAAGKVYLVGRNGAVVVLKASDQLEVLSTNRLNEKIDASPALVGKELFLRGYESLYCIAEK